MRRLLIAATLAAFLVPVAAPQEVFATDRSKFDSLVKKSAPDLAAMFNTFSPKVACVCRATLERGFVAKSINDEIFCYLPSFTAQGDLDFVSGCLDYFPLPK
jgi:hypothetical protein